ncbi:MAG TPA: diguanylate cyclase [Candidatus Limnocylindrales bacterium]
MRIDQLALLFALVLAANLVLLIALQLPRLGQRFGIAIDPGNGGTRANGGAAGGEGSDPQSMIRRREMIGASDVLPVALYQRMTRVVSFMFIGAAMVLAVVSGVPDMTAVIVLLAFGLILIELFQDVLPASAMGRWRLPLEAVIVLVFVTLLIAMTGGHDSPYFFGYILLVGAAAMSASDIGAAVLAVISSLAYLGAVLLDAGSAPLTDVGRGQVAFNLIAIALVMYVASVIGREQRRARDEALRLSRYDSLTGLHSRAYFTTELELEILRAARTGRPFAVAMVDLDGLKAANDRFGHDWGDKLLRAVADVLRGDIRVTDAAARYGGDEFVLMLPETDLSGAILVAEKVRVDISRISLPHNSSIIRTSASLGIVTFPDDGRTSAELMRRADMAMYEAKRRGRDQIVRFARETPAPNSPPAVVNPPSSPGPSPIVGRSAHRYPVTSAGAAVGPGTAHEVATEQLTTIAPAPYPTAMPQPRPPTTPVSPPISAAIDSTRPAEPSGFGIPPASSGPPPWAMR